MMGIYNLNPEIPNLIKTMKYFNFILSSYYIMDNKIVSIVCCAIILILLVIENTKLNNDNKPVDIVQYSLPEEVDEDYPQCDPPQNHPIVIPDYIKNIVKENALSSDVKPILKKY